MYKPTHFVLQEFVPPEAYEKLGERAWELMDPQILESADQVRAKFGRIVINNWHRELSLKESGFRLGSSTIGGEFSAHRRGCALDCHPQEVTPQEMYDYIRTHPEEFPLITTMENIDSTPTWVHIDCRSHDFPRIRIVNP